MTIRRDQVETAVAKLRDRICETMARTGVPGLAVGVVFDDEVRLAEGFGCRALGADGDVDADTVFQVASLSKSLAGSVMCALAGKEAFSWDDPVRTGSPELTLSDPWVSDHVTFADLFSHRSGLPEHAGDLLEDLGFGRDAVFDRLRLYPLAPFRASYGYTNFGLAAAGVIGASRAGLTWEGASEALVYRPLGMASTSSTHAGFTARANRATGHVRRDGNWMVTPQLRQPDGQSPAGGASSSVNDMLLWLATMIRGGTTEAGQVVDSGLLAKSWLPHAIANPPDSPTGRAGFYGLGLNVAYDGGGRLRLGHSGAFALGAGTAMAFFPAERIGIVVLTNGEPTGLAEATVESFFDDVFFGAQRDDWLSVIGPYFDRLIHPAPKKDFAPAGTGESGPEERYIGTYDNELYGPLEVTPQPGAGLQITLGPAGQTYPLHPHAGDEMWWQFAGENAGPPSSASFVVGAGGHAVSVTLDHFDGEGLGTFTRP